MNPDTLNADASSLPLRDIHLPGDISWWPPAIGWWLLLLMIIAAVVFVLWYRKQERQQLTKIAAMREYNRVISNFMNSSNKIYLIRELSVVLRRISISFYPQHNVASLTGIAWLEFLDSVSQPSETGKRLTFLSDTGRLLITAPYEKRSQQQNIPTDKLLELCHGWIDRLPKSINKTIDAETRRFYSARAGKGS